MVENITSSVVSDVVKDVFDSSNMEDYKFLLTEDGGYLLQEDGSKIIL